MGSSRVEPKGYESSFTLPELTAPYNLSVPVNLVVAGGGYVGLATAVGFATLGHQVAIVEIDPARADSLQNGCLPFQEYSLQYPFLDVLRSGRLTIVSEYSQVPFDAQLAFVCTPTPQCEDGNLDTESVFAASASLLSILRSPGFIAIRSTVTPGTANRLQAVVRSLRPDVEILANPEFLREGCALDDFLNPSRVVIGGGNQAAVDFLSGLYRYTTATCLGTDPRTAELIKLASNSALANRVSLANEIASVAAAMDADVEDVLEGVRLDPRIGRDYLSPGIGFGGSCLPKDLSAFRSAASESAIPTPVLDGTARENELTVQRLIERAQHFRDSSGRARVCVVGVAFKTGSDSVRDSRALVLVRSLLQEGFAVSVFDPKAERMARTYLPEAVTFAGSTQEAADNCDLAFVLDGSLVNGTRAFRQREIKLVDPLGRDWKSE